MKVSKCFLLSLFLVLALSVTSSQAGLLGPAGDYNAFVFGTLDVNNSDSKGRFAAGGDMDLDFYQVGSEAGLADYTIVSGGNVDFFSGQVHNGGIFANGNIDLSGQTIYGDVTANGTVTITPPGDGTITGTVTQNAGAATPVDFSSAYSYLNSTSSTLSGMQVNGITDVVYYARPQITLTGSDPVNIFSLDADDLFDVSVITINVDDNAAIINVSTAGNPGQYDRFHNLDITGDFNQSNVLWNFFESSDLTLTTTVRGSILAPNANMPFITHKTVQ